MNDDNNDGMRWDHDPQGAISNDTHLNNVVENVVGKLKTLKVLQLGDREALNVEPFVEQWDTSFKWMTHVKEEAKRQELEDAAKSKEVKTEEAEARNTLAARIARWAIRDVRDAQRFAPRIKETKDDEE